MSCYQLIVKNLYARYFSSIICLTILFAWPVQSREMEVSLIEKAQQLFKPLSENMATTEFPVTPARVDLGWKLFFDPRLSLDGTISCATCHRPALYGTDALPKSIGAKHRQNARNAPTILNAAQQFKAHWLGDRANVEEQATKSLTGHSGFGNPNPEIVIQKIKALPGYAEKFKQAFPDDPEPIKPENWGKAIGAYERTLVSPAPFDAYLKGDNNALTSQARNGLKLFINFGCVSCHNGKGIGGASFQKFGIFDDYWKHTGSQPVDEGRFVITNNPADKYVFKVPSLRNVAMTPPYFHDSSVDNLLEAVRIMGSVQLGNSLNEQVINDLVAFLHSLTGELPEDFATAPVLEPHSFLRTP